MANMDLRNPTAQKLMLSALMAGGVLGVFFCTHFLPFSYPNQNDRLNALKADYERKSTELARARATVADLPRFEAEYEQLHERWSMAAELLPADRQLPTLLRHVTLAAEQTGCSFVSFRPAGNRPAQYYTEMPMQISVTGGYHQLGSFLAELSNMRRIITVSGLHLKPNSKSGDGNITTSAEFTASAYSLNTASAAAAATETSKPAPGAKKEGASNAHKSS
jgi:type IV pilus assembly protein PilO